MVLYKEVKKLNGLIYKKGGRRLKNSTGEPEFRCARAGLLAIITGYRLMTLKMMKMCLTAHFK